MDKQRYLHGGSDLILYPRAEQRKQDRNRERKNPAKEGRVQNLIQEEKVSHSERRQSCISHAVFFTRRYLQQAVAVKQRKETKGNRVYTWKTDNNRVG